jgi:cytochrome c peroxidase
MTLAVAQPPPPPYPPVTAPPENLITEQKRVLGKLLFFEEQLSSDNTVSCGTCHRPGFGGTDPRVARNPKGDNILNTPDDVLGSFGVIRSDSSNRYLRDTVFGLLPQITGRSTNANLGAMFSPDLFWDGRARTTFLNPETNAVSIANGGGLESQAVGPIVNSAEMAHDQRSWTQVTSKLANIVPMILATNLPSDMAAALAGGATYPDLFNAAFGDSAITAERIAFALATYERTLPPNQTPWDAFRAGNNAALSQGQIQGMNTFQASPCAVCHAPPLFTNNTFQNIGLRPIAEDNGRQAVTGQNADRGRFKVPTLRNIGLKTTFMHNGQFTNLNQVIGFYANGAAQFPDNRSPLVPVALPPPTVPAVIDFLSNGLRDPRVAAQQFPFDRPTLHTESPFPNPSVVASGTPGSGGISPTIIANSPPNLGNSDFKVGVMSALGGAQAVLATSPLPPVGGLLVSPTLSAPITLNGTGNGQGYGTWQSPIDQLAVNSCDTYAQWQITDPAAAGGVAFSQVAHLRMIPYLCGGDMNCDGATNGLDIQPFVQAILSPAAFAVDHPGCNAARGDINGDNQVNTTDISLFITLALNQ